MYQKKNKILLQQEPLTTQYSLPERCQRETRNPGHHGTEFRNKELDPEDELEEAGVNKEPHKKEGLSIGY